MATGLDEDYRKPKNLADHLVRLLDDDDISSQDRIRLIVMYLMYRDGLLGGDISKLLAHAQLPPQNGELIYNLDLLGVRVQKHLKDSKPPPPPIFPRKPPPTNPNEETNISRFEPAVKLLLEEHCRGFVDPVTFPSTRPHLDQDNMSTQDSISQASLRSAKPTWARTRPSRDEPRQRVIIFMAGGATYAEARSCYEVSQDAMKDVYLTTSHMLTPGLFMRQVGDLSVDKRRLDLPYDRPPPKAPDHLFERDPPPPAPPKPTTQLVMPGPGGGPPTAQMANMNIQPRQENRPPQPAPSSNGSAGLPPAPAGGKLKKSKEEKKMEEKRRKEEEKRLKEEEKKDKKKRGFFK